ncbi:hypothetical protein BJ508DRAFT_333616 [Ascobolus immersus RN42]|uniref:Uncharacterized protein n=1 Tax=Ascobolus immersus RN42 TaxID=1160509 RepID=A0A3N4HN38_ASCIM|nr:hypothetical protein BJ508DRAFT_333616 [Ascobolus immersus RN42]
MACPSQVLTLKAQAHNKFRSRRNPESGIRLDLTLKTLAISTASPLLEASTSPSQRSNHRRPKHHLEEARHELPRIWKRHDSSTGIDPVRRIASPKSSSSIFHRSRTTSPEQPASQNVKPPARHSLTPTIANAIVAQHEATLATSRQGVYWETEG